jgi:hypothetical protein
MRSRSSQFRCLAVALTLLAARGTSRSAEPLPGFPELESAGATIGIVSVRPQEIFDTSDPEENKLLFRWANALHVRTRPFVIERALLFKSGDPVSVRLIDETERILRSSRYLYDVRIVPVAYHDGVVDIDVITRDTWSLDAGFSFGRAGGSNSTSVHLLDHNLLGTGVFLSVGRSSDVDRTSNEFKVANDRLFGTQATFSLSHDSNSDGRRDEAILERPFYALDARWAAGISGSRDDRIDSIYTAGVVSSQFRHRENAAEVYAGWSEGLVDRRAHRYSAGLSLVENTYAFEPGRPNPPQLPANEHLVAPFVRYELAEDHYERLINHNLIGRPEFFALGLAAKVQLGWASTALGSTADMALYKARIDWGIQPAGDQTVTATATLLGRYRGGRAQQQQTGGVLRWYVPQGPRFLFYAAANVDWLTNPAPTEALLLGGDNGLRGYPLRYQSGNRRALVTLEERAFSDIYIYRLFRVGGAAFFDVGRAWGGAYPNLLNPGWLSDVGFGLRIGNVRSAFSNVLHVDIAFPLNRTSDIKKIQFIVKTKTTF